GALLTWWSAGWQHDRHKAHPTPAWDAGVGTRAARRSWFRDDLCGAWRRPGGRIDRPASLGSDQRPLTPCERVETRQLARDGYVSVDANRYPVPLEWVEAVKVRIVAEEIWIHRPGVDAVHHARLLGKHQVAPWNGPARRAPVPARPVAPSSAPAVRVRGRAQPSSYEGLTEKRRLRRAGSTPLPTLTRRSSCSQSGGTAGYRL